MEIEKRRNYNFYDILGDRAKLWFTLMYGRLLLKRLIIVDVVKTGGRGGTECISVYRFSQPELRRVYLASTRET